MTLPIIGPWCDTARFTDTRLLVDLAGESREAALGVLANHNVTGDDLAAVAERAALTAPNIDKIHEGAALLVGRTATDQVTILVAAAARSTAAAERLVYYLGPEAALRVYQRATTTRMRGGAALVADIGALVRRSSFLEHAADPSFHACVRTVLGDDPETDQILLRVDAMNAFGDPQRLLALTDRIAAQPDRLRGYADELLETLLLSTHGHPDVVAHWATHGGVLGAQVGAYDHRQDPALLTTLRGPGVRPLLMNNPAVPYDTRGKWLAKKLRKELAAKEGALGRVLSAAETLQEERHRWRKVRLDDMSTNRNKHVKDLFVFWSTADEPSRLFVCDLVANSKVKGELLQQLLRDLVAGDLHTAPLAPVIAAALPRCGDLEYQTRDTLSELFPDLVAADVDDVDTIDVDRLALRQLLQLPDYDRHTSRWTVRGADELASRLTRARQWTELYRAAASTRGRNLGQTIAEITAATPEPDALAELIPSGLGAL